MLSSLREWASSPRVQVTSAIAAAAAAGIATLGFYLRTRAAYQRLAHDVHQTIERWMTLRNTIEAVNADEFSPGASSGSSPGINIVPGQRVQVMAASEVSNSSLWDAKNTDYCGFFGTVFKVDADDGDVDVRFDDGVTITCDVKHLRAVSLKQRQLKEQSDDMNDRMLTLRKRVGPLDRAALLSGDIQS